MLVINHWLITFTHASLVKNACRWWSVMLYLRYWIWHGGLRRMWVFTYVKTTWAKVEFWCVFAVVGALFHWAEIILLIWSKLKLADFNSVIIYRVFLIQKMESKLMVIPYAVGSSAMMRLLAKHGYLLHWLVFWLKTTVISWFQLFYCTLIHIFGRVIIWYF